MYKKITFISCLLAVCTALPLTAANTGDDVKPANTKEQTPAQPKDKRIVCDKSSVFQVSKQEKDGKEDWFFTLPDSLLGRLFQCVTRFTRTPAGFSQFGGEEVREQTVYFELSPDKKNLFLRSSVIYSKADTLDAISQAVSNSTIDPIIQSFKLESGAPKNQYKINVSNLIMGENNFALPNMYRSAMGVGGPMGNGASYIESIHSYPIYCGLFANNSRPIPFAFVEQGYITDFDYSTGFSTDVVTTPPSHTQEYFDEVVEKFHGTQFVLLKDFGSISVADNVDNALNYLAWMEEVCQKIVRAEMIGDIQWIDE